MKIRYIVLAAYEYFGIQQNTHELIEDDLDLLELRFYGETWARACRSDKIACPSTGVAVSFEAGVGACELGIEGNSQCFIIDGIFYKRVSYGDLRNKPKYISKYIKNHKHKPPQRGFKIAKNKKLIYFLKKINILLD